MKYDKTPIRLEDVPEEAHKRLDMIDTFEWGMYSQGAWSHSKYKTLHKCPLKYLLDYILKIRVKGPEELDEIGSLRHRGTAAHTILELARQGLSIEEAYEKAKEMHFHEVTEKYWGEVEDLRYNIDAFLDRFRQFEIREGVDTAYTELKIAVNKDWEPVPFFSKNAHYRGVIDLPVVLKNQDAIIVDHKHGGNPDFGLRNYNDQLDSYKALFYFGVRKVNNIAGGINFIQAGEPLIGPTTPASVIERLPAKIDTYIDSATQYVEEIGRFKQQRNSLCQYCDHKSICHGGKRGTANMLTEVVEHSEVLLNGSKADQGSGEECSNATGVSDPGSSEQS